MSYGLSPKWIEFANTRGAAYNYKDYDYKKDLSVIHLGLDCSGYVGWVLYNLFRDGNGYVFKARNVVKRLSDAGTGKYVERNKVKKHRAGDIMSSACSCCNHVYICVGECDDGSVVLLHSSPCGVQLSGTYTPEGDAGSKAAAIAEKYMRRYYPRWMARFPDIARDAKYLTHYEQLENTYLSDNEGLRTMNPDEVLDVIFKPDCRL
jgi:radical SAM protein with 4Fe4S-binding SPASM domain